MSDPSRAGPSQDAASPADRESEPRRTPLHALHVELGARMVDFAGWALPVQYPAGIMAEHRQCRDAAALFDVSHMGQVLVHGDRAAEAFEALVPGNITELREGRLRYTLLTNRQGGVLDDLIVGRAADGLHVVVNAACREADLAHLRAALEPALRVEELSDRALLALQGPAAAAVMARLAPDAVGLRFMQAAELDVAGQRCRIARSGYTGEDGFEISVAADAATALAKLLLDQPEVGPAGLGARDSLRLEAGLCLYGHELTPEITPIEAGLAWTIGKRWREQGGFPGAEVILRQLREGPPRKLVGIRPEGRAPAREGTEIHDANGRAIGFVSSGGFGPTVGGPIALGYVASPHARPDTPVLLIVRGRPLPARIVETPFVPHRYAR
ncbi:MAG TPA: glycine cleavage system aminomethyltransferase GcvT [Geminicoccaceae bacterium]|nr:glycine cleavage system aminomethyltransferase GcvT [Geminicoccaceae bacterium]